ncbi:DUF6443 domain-containing protein [Chitinophaga rhizophila]|uniref:HNH nuclease domain-containing protein n=1 Tax=Chitinophaga rhizophila TaxID=2866212 RepID=A0ABS7GHT4_9BACT|nr:DUF6443 domain-containing protein [Chitinophaga rhizophila]MBW8687265.1 hypothetical protein [Chitinophaga rhizophila]
MNKIYRWLLLLIVAIQFIIQPGYAAPPASGFNFPFPLTSHIGMRAVSIEGPTCILPGFPVSFYSSGTYITDASQWCVNGGEIQGSSSSCKSGTPVQNIIVTYTLDASSTQISLTVNGGSYTTFSPVVLNSDQINVGGTQQIVQGSTAAALAPIETAPECSGFTYQWQRRISSGSWTDIAGATGASYSPGAVTETTEYRREVSANGNSLLSDPVTVQVTAALDAGDISSPVSGSIAYNASPGTLISVSAASGGTGGAYAYLWQKSSNGSSWTDISGANAETYNPGSLTATTYYRRKVSRGSETKLSNAITISVFAQFTLGNINSPVSSAINNGVNPGTINGSAAAGGGCNGAYTYQWQSSVNDGTYTNISGATTQNYNPGTMTASRYFRLAVGCGSENKTTNAIYIQVYPAINPGIINGNQTIDYNDVPSQLTGSVATGGNGTVGYQWQSSADNISFNSIFGATSINYSPSALTATTYYRRVASSNGASANSNVLTVTVNGAITSGGNITPATKTVNYNTSPGQLSCTLPTGGGPYAYQWQSSDNGTSWTDISGAVSQNYTPGNLTSKKYYRREVTSGGSTSYSNTAVISVYTQLVAGSITPASATIPYNSVVPTLTANPSGGNGTYSYQWQTSLNNTTWSNYPGIAKQDLDYDTSLTVSTYFRVIVSSNGVNATSSSALVTVQPRLNPGIVTPKNPGINFNTTPGTLSVSPSGGTGSYSYQWQTTNETGDWINVGTSSSGYTPGNLTNDTYFRCLVTSGSVTAYSQQSLVTVYDVLKAGTLMPLVQTVMPNTATTPISANPSTGGSGIYVHLWQKSSNGTSWTDVAGSNTLTYNPGELSANTYYRLKVSSNGVTVYSAPALVQVQLNGGQIGVTAASVSAGGSVTLNNVSAASNGSCGGSYTYTWQKSFNEIDWTDFPSATVSNITVPTYYRRKVSCGSEVTYSNTVLVRISNATASIPDTVTMVSATQQVATIPAYGSGASATNMNYIRERSISKAGITTEVAAAALSSPNDVQQETDYYDGLGRDFQTVKRQATAGGKDLVSLHFYDPYDREPLSFERYGASSSDGNFKLDPATAQPAFYHTLYAGKENYFYSRNIYENSTDREVLEIRRPGKSWEGNARSKRMLVRTNRATEGIRIWKIGYNETDRPTSTAAYAVGSLLVTETSDEAHNKIIRYKDKSGRLVMMKSQAADQITEDHAGWLCTYYVYDEMDKLRCIIPPKAVSAIKNTWVLDAGTHTELCFSSYFDDNGNEIVDRTPGGKVVEHIYDSRERLTFSRDNLQRHKSRWAFVMYDDLNRQIVNGYYSSASARSALQTQLDNGAAGTQTISHTYQDVNLVLEQHSGITLYQATSSITFLPGFDSDNDTFVAEISAAASGETVLIKPNNFLSGISAGQLRPEVYYYYDDYKFPGAQPAVAADLSKPLALSNVNADVHTVFAPITTSLVTGVRSRVIGTDQWLTTTSYYNPREKISQVIEQNISGASTTSTMLYNFAGQLLSKYVYHKNGNGNQYLPALYLNHLNTAGQTDSVKIWLNNDSKLQRLIAHSSYNELGQLNLKKLGATGSNTQLEKLAYNYTLSGEIEGINADYVNTIGSTANWFGQLSNYDKGFSGKEYNGLMSGTKWKSRSANIARSLAFSYDNSDRLVRSSFNQQNDGGSTWLANKADFSSAFTYDDNGNQLWQVHKGLDGPVLKTIDSLEYGYFANSNKLNYVKDHKNEPASKRGDFKETTNDTSRDYWYDPNFNISRDQNRGIDSIRYNDLNLPEYVSVTGKGIIAYTYNAIGKKLRKTVTDNTVSPARKTVTDYINGYVYVNDTLKEISHEEGRIRAEWKGTTQSFVFDYFAKDYQGNTRVVLTTQSDTSRYMATMEYRYTATENILFSNIDLTRSAKPSGYPADATTNPNTSVAKLNAQNGQKIGPSIVLRVMAGDTLQAGVKAFYKSGGSTSYAAPATDMVTALLSSFSANGVVDGIHKGSGVGSPITSMNGSLYNQVKNNDPAQNLSDRPKAYLTYAAFDDQFNLVNENSAVRQVQNSPDILQTLATGEIVIKKTGFIYIYVNNENGQDVYFDNLSVIHTSGPLLEENHHYPYGQAMAGISARALKGTQYRFNKRWFNGNELQSEEFDDGSGLELYDFNARTYDAQLGRFLQIDPETKEQENFNPYHFGFNNPVKFADPDGRKPVPGFAIFAPALAEAALALGAATGLTAVIVQGIDKLKHVDWRGLASEIGGGAGTSGVPFTHKLPGATQVSDIQARYANKPVSQGQQNQGNSTKSANKSASTSGSAGNKQPTKKGDYSHLKEPKKVGAGLETTRSQRKRILEENKRQNDGKLVSDESGKTLNPPSKAEKGKPADPNQAEVDHIDPKSKGGTNSNSNLRVISKEENQKKYNKSN